MEINTLTHEVIGAAINVHRELGAGYLESVYEEALCYELSDRQLVFSRQHPIAINYKGRPVGQSRLDLFVENQLIVELKAVEQFAPIHTAQAISYLKATGLSLALLINFNVTVLTRNGIKRVRL